MAENNDKYIFISYSHQNEDVVYKYIDALQKNGFRLWYDHGISAGEYWPDVIASHLYGCEVCLAFVSKDFMNSHNCKRELNATIDGQKHMIVILLEKPEHTPAMRMLLANIQAIKAYEQTAEKTLEDIMKLPMLAGCKGDVPIADPIPKVRPPEKKEPEPPRRSLWDHINTHQQSQPAQHTSEPLTAHRTKKLVCSLTAVRGGQTAQLEEGILVLGRSKECGLSIIDNTVVGRKHAVVSKRDGKFYVKDNNSLNHTILNELTINQETQLSNGDTLVLGDEKIKVEIFEKNN